MLMIFITLVNKVLREPLLLFMFYFFKPTVKDIIFIKSYKIVFFTYALSTTYKNRFIHNINYVFNNISHILYINTYSLCKIIKHKLLETYNMCIHLQHRNVPTNYSIKQIEATLSVLPTAADLSCACCTTETLAFVINIMIECRLVRLCVVHFLFCYRDHGSRSALALFLIGTLLIHVRKSNVNKFCSLLQKKYY